MRQLRQAIAKFGKENIVYFDESGFEQEVVRSHGWAAKGVRISGNFPGRRPPRDNLIMAQRRREWLAPMIFKGSCNSAIVNTWIEDQLLPELTEPSVIVMDNASFHQKATIKELLEAHGHMLLPLPPYSPDFNPIETSFAILKKRRQFGTPPPKIDELVVCRFGLD